MLSPPRGAGYDSESDFSCNFKTCTRIRLARGSPWGDLSGRLGVKQQDSVSHLACQSTNGPRIFTRQRHRIFVEIQTRKTECVFHLDQTPSSPPPPPPCPTCISASEVPAKTALARSRTVPSCLLRGWFGVWFCCRFCCVFFRSGEGG